MLDSDEESDDSSMQYLPASPGAPMSVQQLHANHDDAGNHATAHDETGNHATAHDDAGNHATAHDDAGNHATAQNPCITPDTSAMPDERRPRLPQEWRPANGEVKDDPELCPRLLPRREAAQVLSARRRPDDCGLQDKPRLI